jgi:hypothetical protein
MDTPPPDPGLRLVDLDQFGTRYDLPPFWLEEVVASLRRGASDSEILTQLRSSSSVDALNAQTFPLPDEQAAGLLRELRLYIQKRPG